MEKSLTTKDYKVLVQLLRTARKSRGITQVELASRLEVVQSFISGCEHGQRRLDMVEVRQWCRALGMSFPEFAAQFDEKAQTARGRKG